MVAVAILSALGALDLVAIASMLGAMGAAEAQRKVLQFAAEKAGELLTWDRSVLNPANWSGPEDDLVSEASRYVQSESLTLTEGTSAADVASLSRRAFEQIALTFQDMGEVGAVPADVSLRKPEEARAEMEQLVERISRLPKKSPSGNGPGLPPEVYAAALRLAAAGSSIAIRTLDQWGKMSEGFRTRLGAVCNKLFEAARKLADVAGAEIRDENGIVIAHKLENEMGILIERFRHAVGEFYKAMYAARGVVDEFSATLNVPANSAVGFVARNPGTMIEQLMLSGRANPATVDQIMYAWLKWEMAEAPNVLRQTEQLYAAIQTAVNATKGYMP
jgi:hypothetical protein